MLSGKKSTESALDAKEKVTSEMVQRAINEIAHPYTFTFKSVEWFTCYPIGQRLVSRYSLPAGTHAGVAFPAHHVFLAGDACHTHSPKAGQGMNTALIDAQALSWRINLVQKGLAKHDLLETYHTERHATGKKLIEFDSEYSALFSGELPKNKPEVRDFCQAQRMLNSHLPRAPPYSWPSYPRQSWRPTLSKCSVSTPASRRALASSTPTTC